MNGLDEEYVIRNLDKRLGDPNFNPDLSIKEFKSQLKQVGCAAEQNEEIAPVDAMPINFVRKWASIPSIPLITGSALSRKLAEGAESLVVDVKWGNGSFIRDRVPDS